MALIPPFFLDCVVAIGLISSNDSKQWVASGFLYGELVKQGSALDENEYRLFLITNRHVFEGHKLVFVRFNPEAEEPARELQLLLEDPKGERQWFPHSDPKIDVAIVPVDAHALKEDKIRFSVFLSDRHVLDREKAIGQGISEGDGAFILGGPSPKGPTQDRETISSGSPHAGRSLEG